MRELLQPMGELSMTHQIKDDELSIGIQQIHNNQHNQGGGVDRC
jgi:hypothetical protein